MMGLIYLMRNKERALITLMMVGFFAIMITVMVVGSQLAEEYRFNNYVNDYTCDELGIKISDTESSLMKKAHYEKCMQEELPTPLDYTGERYYPTRVEIQQYLLTQSCEELGVLILKNGFEYAKATELYNVKCGTPLEHLELPEIVLDVTKEKTITTEETWIKSDESNYGKQYGDEK